MSHLDFLADDELSFRQKTYKLNSLMLFPTHPTKALFSEMWHTIEAIVPPDKMLEGRFDLEWIEENKEIGAKIGEAIAHIGGWSLLMVAPKRMDLIKEEVRNYQRAIPAVTAFIGTVFQVPLGRKGKKTFNAWVKAALETVEGLGTKDFPPIKTEPVLRKAWKYFRPVIHLWAGLECWKKTTLNKNPHQGVGLEILSSENDLLEFLFGAACCREKAATTNNYYKEPLIGREFMWDIPRKCLENYFSASATEIN